MSLRLHLDGLAALRGWLRRARERLERRDALHEHAGRAVTDWIDRNFESEGALALGGAGWPALDRRTLAARRRAGQGARILQATGRLRAGTRRMASRAAAVVDNPVPYAARHQLGLGVPARPFFPTRSQAAAVVRPEAETFVREALQ